MTLQPIQAAPISAPNLLHSPAEISPEEKRRRWLELGLVLLIGFSRPIVAALYLLKHGPAGVANISGARWVEGTIHAAGTLLLLAYVLSRGKRGFRSIGFCWSVRDVGMGVLLAISAFFTYVAALLTIRGVYFLIEGVKYHSYGGKDFFHHAGPMVIPYLLINAFHEELIVRAYLMTEIITLTGSKTWAIVLSVAFQCAYHLYYGWLGAISIAFLFLPFAIYFAITRRSLPVVVAHGFYDLTMLPFIW